MDKFTKIDVNYAKKIIKLFGANNYFTVDRFIGEASVDNGVVTSKLVESLVLELEFIEPNYLHNCSDLERLKSDNNYAEFKKMLLETYEDIKSNIQVI